MTLGPMVGRREALSDRRGRPTLGGGRIWADLWVRSGWRVQQHALTGETRLLDARNRVRTGGPVEHCIEAGRHLAPSAAGPHAVVLLHGLGCTRGRMARLERALTAEGHAVANVGYPSLLGSLAGHAERLHQVIAGLEEATEAVSFVTHSLGGLVLRACLADPAPWMERIALGRAVLIAPPSRGAALAEFLDRTPLYRRLAGPCGVAVLPRRAAALPPPPCPFGIIAGGTGRNGFNPMLAGDDDGVVRVAETRLADETDFLRIRAVHGLIAQHPATLRATLAFLRTGRFNTMPGKGRPWDRAAVPVARPMIPAQGDSA